MRTCELCRSVTQECTRTEFLLKTTDSDSDPKGPRILKATKTSTSSSLIKVRFSNHQINLKLKAEKGLSIYIYLWVEGQKGCSSLKMPT